MPPATSAKKLNGRKVVAYQCEACELAQEVRDLGVRQQATEDNLVGALGKIEDKLATISNQMLSQAEHLLRISNNVVLAMQRSEQAEKAANDLLNAVGRKHA